MPLKGQWTREQFGAFCRVALENAAPPTPSEPGEDSWEDDSGSDAFGLEEFDPTYYGPEEPAPEPAPESPSLIPVSSSSDHLSHPSFQPSSETEVFSPPADPTGPPEEEHSPTQEADTEPAEASASADSSVAANVKQPAEEADVLSAEAIAPDEVSGLPKIVDPTEKGDTEPAEHPAPARVSDSGESAYAEPVAVAEASEERHSKRQRRNS